MGIKEKFDLLSEENKRRAVEKVRDLVFMGKNKEEANKELEEFIDSLA